MSDIFDETEENLRADKWMTIVKKALPWVSAVLALALVITLGIWGFQSWQENVTAKSSVAYQAAIEANAKSDTATAKAKFQDLAKTGNAAYKTMALMQLGALAVTDNKTDEAVKDFDQAAKAGGDPMMSDLAALKAAYLVMDKAPFADISKRLTPLTADKRPLAPLAKEALAMAKLQSGDVKGARSDLQVLSVGLDVPAGIKQRAAMVVEVIDSGAAPTAQNVAKLPEVAMPVMPQLAPGQQLQQLPSDAQAVQPAQ